MSYNSMNKSDLEKLSKAELIDLLLNKKTKRKPIPTPRKSVKQMVTNYEKNIILPPTEFRDKPIPLPRTKKQIPTPMPRTKITKRKTAIKDNALSFEISIRNNKDPLQQLKNTRKAVGYHLIHLLTSMKGLKFIECIKATYTKISNGEMEYKTAYFFSSPNIILNHLDVEKSLQLSQNHIYADTLKVSSGFGNSH